jgi:hypothetical protein
MSQDILGKGNGKKYQYAQITHNEDMGKSKD